MRPGSGEVRWLRKGSEVPRELAYPAGSLLVVGGMPGVGKTTLLERLGHAHDPAGESVVVLNADAMYKRACARKSRRPKTMMQLRGVASLMIESEIARALADEKTVIVDAPAMFPHLREGYADQAEIYGRPVHALYVTTARRKARRSQRKRGRVIKRASQRRYEEEWDLLCEELERGKAPHGYDSATVIERDAGAGLEVLSFEAVTPCQPAA